jgi:hypothetical protein
MFVAAKALASERMRVCKETKLSALFFLSLSLVVVSS